jgi:hypothetical protein
MLECSRFSWGSEVRDERVEDVSAGGGSWGLGVDVCNSCGARGRCSTSWPLVVEAGYELSVGEPGGVEFVGAFAELDADIGHLCLE